MEQQDAARQQFAPQQYAVQQTQQTAAPSDVSYGAAGPVQRVRQTSYLQSSPTSDQASARRASDVQQVYNYSPGSQFGPGSAMQAGSLQYPQEMSPSEVQRQQTQQFTPYGEQILYTMTPQAPSAPAVAPQYDHQYRQRSSTASDSLSSPFAIPQLQYYMPGPAGAQASSASQLPPQYQQQPNPYTQSSLGTALTYSTNIMNTASTNPTYSAYVAQPHAQYALQQPQQQESVPSQTDDQAFNRYQAQTRTIFSLAHEGALRDVYNNLLDISQYLLGNAESLGLTRDDDTLHEGRIRLWDEFNRAWLVCLQRQLDLTEAWLGSGQPLREPRSIMSSQALERLAHELIRLCDNVERHGLVDYQMGVAEEEIMNLLLRCLIALDATSEPRSVYQSRMDPPATAGASSER